MIIDEAHKCSAASPLGPGRAARAARPHQALRARRGALAPLRAAAADDRDAALRRSDALSQLPAAARPRPVRGRRSSPPSRSPPTTSPYFLRREKETLKDEHGDDLFVPREVLTQPFDARARRAAPLRGGHRLHPGVPRRRCPAGGATAIALARTVLQRRLASSLGAIRSSLRKRAERIGERLAELEALPPAERARRLRELRLAEPLDAEQEIDDATEDDEEAAVEGVVVAETLDGMRAEIKRARAARPPRRRADRRAASRSQARRAARLPAASRARRAARRPRQAADLHRAPRHARLPASATCASGATRPARSTAACRRSSASASSSCSTRSARSASRPRPPARASTSSSAT